MPKELPRLLPKVTRDIGGTAFGRLGGRNSPNLEATYAELLDEPLLPARLEILIIVALDFITLEAALQPQKSAFQISI